MCLHNASYRNISFITKCIQCQLNHSIAQSIAAAVLGSSLLQYLELLNWYCGVFYFLVCFNKAVTYRVKTTSVVDDNVYVVLAKLLSLRIPSVVLIHDKVCTIRLSELKIQYIYLMPLHVHCIFRSLLRPSSGLSIRSLHKISN